MIRYVIAEYFTPVLLPQAAERFIVDGIAVKYFGIPKAGFQLDAMEGYKSIRLFDQSAMVEIRHVASTLHV